MLRDIFTLQMFFFEPSGKHDHPCPEPCNTRTGREQMTKIVPETVVSTGYSVDRALITLLEMGCRYFFKRRVRCLDLCV